MYAVIIKGFCNSITVTLLVIDYIAFMEDNSKCDTYMYYCIVCTYPMESSYFMNEKKEVTNKWREPK